MGLVIVFLPILLLYFWGGVVLTRRVCDYIQRRTHSTAAYVIWSLLGCLAVQVVMVLISFALVQLVGVIFLGELPGLKAIDLRDWRGDLKQTVVIGIIFWALGLVRYWRFHDRESD